ncbi:hypothetical protein [Streptomyces sp. NPDC127100]|uniref:hypothetical protein n=1 Tax=Streptomyces sp. NPDC127100 TaxID=3347138 RepID=UPI0036697414
MSQEIKVSRTAQKVFGAIIAIMAVATLVTGLYSIHNQERITRCQADINHQFIVQLRARNEISTSDRESLARTIQGFLQPGTRESRKKLLEDYLKTKEENDAKRQKHPLPALPSDASC